MWCSGTWLGGDGGRGWLEQILAVSAKLHDSLAVALKQPHFTFGEAGLVLAPCPPPQHKAMPGGAVPLAGEPEALADENSATEPFSTPRPLQTPPSASPRGAGALLGGSPRPSGPGGDPETPERAPGTPWGCRGR